MFFLCFKQKKKKIFLKRQSFWDVTQILYGSPDLVKKTTSLFVESIKDLDQDRIDLLFEETTKWYNCTIADARQRKFIKLVFLVEIRERSSFRLIFNLYFGHTPKPYIIEISFRLSEVRKTTRGRAGRSRSRSPYRRGRSRSRGRRRSPSYGWYGNADTLR